jgi:hypothetical protein
MEAVLQFETGEAQELGRLTKVDPLRQEVPDRGDVRSARIRTTDLRADGTGRKPTEQAIVDRIHQDDSLLAGASDDQKLSVVHPLEKRVWLLGKLFYGDEGGRHGLNLPESAAIKL